MIIDLSLVYLPSSESESQTVSLTDKSCPAVPTVQPSMGQASKQISQTFYAGGDKASQRTRHFSMSIPFKNLRSIIVISAWVQVLKTLMARGELSNVGRLEP
jgi:hypothetical protein